MVGHLIQAVEFLLDGLGQLKGVSAILELFKFCDLGGICPRAD